MTPRKRAKDLMPPNLSESHSFVFALGSMVVAWGNCETLLLALMECVAGRPDAHSAPVVWLSQRNTNARIDLVKNLIRLHRKLDDEAPRLFKLLDRFKGVTRVRNYFCHSGFTVDADSNLCGVYGYSLSLKGAVSQEDRRPLNKALINQVLDCTDTTRDLICEFWQAVIDVREILQAQHVGVSEGGRRAAQDVSPRPHPPPKPRQKARRKSSEA